MFSIEEHYMLEVRDLSKHYRLRRLPPSAAGVGEGADGESCLPGRTAVLKAVDEVSFGVKEGEIFALVGRSGSGKTTLARTIVGLQEPTSGQVVYKGKVVGKQLGILEFRNEVQMVFQDSGDALNPRMSVYKSLEEPLLLRRVGDRKERGRRIDEMVGRLGLPMDILERRPCELSGGQRQRICLARALLTNPRVLIADEPMAGLDLSVKAQIWNLLLDLHQELRLTYLIISHDLTTISYMADRIALMEAGRITQITVGHPVASVVTVAP